MFDLHRYYRNVQVAKYEEKPKSDGGRSSVPFRNIIMLETLQGDLGCNRRVEGLCSCVSYQLMHLEVKLNLAIFHHISSTCNSEAILYPLFGLSSIHLQV